MTSPTPRNASSAASETPTRVESPETADGREREYTGAPGTSTAPEASPGRGTARNPHTRGNWRSLLLSMAAVAGVVLVLYSVVPRPESVTQPPVDVTPVARQLRDESGVTVWIPQLGEPGRPWRATSVRRETSPAVTWYAGYGRSDDDKVFVAVQQTPASTATATKDPWIKKAVSAGRPDGSVSAAGTTWTRYTTGGDPVRRGLVGELGGMTTVVSGLADYATLEKVASSLRPYAG